MPREHVPGEEAEDDLGGWSTPAAARSRESPVVTGGQSMQLPSGSTQGGSGPTIARQIDSEGRVLQEVVLPQVPYPWKVYVDPASGKPYYHNRVAKTVQWDFPDDPPPPPPPTPALPDPQPPPPQVNTGGAAVTVMSVDGGSMPSPSTGEIPVSAQVVGGSYVGGDVPGALGATGGTMEAGPRSSETAPLDPTSGTVQMASEDGTNSGRAQAVSTAMTVNNAGEIPVQPMTKGAGGTIHGQAYTTARPAAEATQWGAASKPPSNWGKGEAYGSAVATSGKGAGQGQPATPIPEAQSVPQMLVDPPAVTPVIQGPPPVLSANVDGSQARQWGPPPQTAPPQPKGGSWPHGNSGGAESKAPMWPDASRVPGGKGGRNDWSAPTTREAGNPWKSRGDDDEDPEEWSPPRNSVVQAPAYKRERSRDPAPRNAGPRGSGASGSGGPGSTWAALEAAEQAHEDRQRGHQAVVVPPASRRVGESGIETVDRGRGMVRATSRSGRRSEQPVWRCITPRVEAQVAEDLYLLYRLIRAHYNDPDRWSNPRAPGDWITADSWERLRWIFLSLKDPTPSMRIWGYLRGVGPRTLLTSLKLPPAPVTIEWSDRVSN